ncbi:MAG: hypothetical protein OXU77_18625 [Gammaproteobacteria bacterium]|nr:hypothetical protein [Gammaproteobacteria bacterium]
MSSPTGLSRHRAELQRGTFSADRFLRLRVGDWRVVMRDAGTLEVLRITTRGHACRE